ncbi:MAG: polysaccharide pyruvyl transferase family protein [Gammaproteobacteria bacterium]|nr:polysaccharide pyruvyl transferase family protein [Gammaproteobacteria bacterium]
MSTHSTVRVLHLASFSGNIGDNINHNGLRRLFAENLSVRFDYTELEMREFYWGERQFDEDFTAYANQFDLLLIGGGNYFELWVEKSRTGCSIDLPPKLLKRLKVPVLFYGLGVDAGQGVPDICRRRFSEFLDTLLSNDQFRVVIRNDGAGQTLREYFGNGVAEQIPWVPDSGFFCTAAYAEHAEYHGGNDRLLINLANDMLEARFPDTLPDGLDYPGFIQGIAELIESQLAANPALRVVLVPHIYRDLTPITDLLNQLPDPIRRRSIRVAPYLTGETGAQQAISLYGQATRVLGMRLHASVCALSQETPVVGMVSYPQLGHLYRELEMSHRTVAVNHRDMVPQLEQRIAELNRPDSRFTVECGNRLEQLRSQVDAVQHNIDTWLSSRLH